MITKIGSLNDFAKDVVSQIDLNDVKKIRVPLISFCLVDKDPKDYKNLSDLARDCSGWYGLKEIEEPAFDSSDLILYGDYFGGGCAHLVQISDGFPEKCAISDIILFLKNILDYNGEYFPNSTYLWEYTKFKTKRKNKNSK